jgi:hypothetical protein
MTHPRSIARATDDSGWETVGTQGVAASVRHLEERWRGRRQGGVHVPPPSFEIGSFDLDRHEVALS